MWKKIFNSLSSVVIVLTILSLGINFGYVRAESNQQGILPTLAEQLPAPPVNFNPLVATSAELLKYGFPDRPTDERELSTWENAMAHAKYYVKPDQKPSTAVHGLVGTVYSTNWAGYVVNCTDNIRNGYTPKYTVVHGFWTQPTYSGSADPSFWMGIGGWVGSSCVVQAGADSNALAIGGSSRYEFWVEDYPLGTIWQAQPAVSGGNQLYVSVVYNGATSMAFLENATTGQYTSVVFNTPYYDGKSADYIYEAVGVPTLPYGSWGSTQFLQCTLCWKDSSGASGAGYFTNYNYTKVIMRTSGGVTKAVPSSASNGNLTITSY
jgi:hypothetical protein